MNFTDYLLDFYGPNGVYPHGFTAAQIGIATAVYKMRLDAQGGTFEGDSIDRERVRDIILEAREGVLPEFAAF